jgi:hypothetical protein
MSGDVIPFNPLIDHDRIAELLVEHDGNVSKVADILGVNSGKLRRLVEKTPALSDVIDESLAVAADEAVGVLFEGLRDGGSFQNRFYAAKEFLRSKAGKRRGFGPLQQQLTAEISARESGQSRVITLKWLEPPKEESGT